MILLMQINGHACMYTSHAISCPSSIAKADAWPKFWDEAFNRRSDGTSHAHIDRPYFKLCAIATFSNQPCLMDLSLTIR